MANVPLIDEGTGNGGGGVHDGRCPGLEALIDCHTPANQLVCLRAHESGKAAAMRTRNLEVFGAEHAGIPGSVPSPTAPVPPSGKPIGLPGNDGVGWVQKQPNIFSYLSLTIFQKGLLSTPSCPTERGDRDRHVRGAGCGGRRRCGVTGDVGDGCLRAGRICASTATGKETAGLRMERACRSSDGRPSQNAFGLLA
jgi:hypothetical protein